MNLQLFFNLVDLSGDFPYLVQVERKAACSFRQDCTPPAASHGGRKGGKTQTVLSHQDKLLSGTAKAFGRQERHPCLGLVCKGERKKLAHFRNPRAGEGRKSQETGRKERGFDQSVCRWWGWGCSCVPLIYQLTDLWEERRLLLEIINGLERGAGLPRHEAIKGEKGAWLQRLSGPGCNE